MKGTEVEGLYRLSGSKKEMVMWQRRFEMGKSHPPMFICSMLNLVLEGDVDLLAEQELYDVNVVASLLKDWLRNIPDEIFPRSTQKMIADMCPDAANLESCPKIMQDELSRLPPFNYYLLFAITCHLSLLTSCFERTKMDFDNLCVCIQPSLGLDRFTFRILIRDWRNCWQGCWTEKDYLAVENDWIANQANGQPDPRGWTPDPREPEGRTLSSAGSNNASMTGSSTTEERPERPLPKTIRTINPSDNETTPRIPRKAAPAHPNHTLAHDMTPTRAHPQTDVSYDQRTELSPLKPLSPMVFP